MSSLSKFVTFVVTLYVTAALAMTLLQRSFQYFPDRSAMTPARAGFPAAETVTLRTGDGETLVAWWKPPANERAVVYLYLHGNAGNLMLRGERLEYMARDGSGVLALSWRGYGGSTGKPSETGLHLDAAAAYSWLQERVVASRIVLFGESLGTAPAIKLASEREVAALILDSPFSSALDIAMLSYWWLPVRWLMFDQLKAIDDAPKVTAPVLAVHCRRDPIIPLALAEKLFAAFPKQPEVDIIENVCHVASLEAWKVKPGEFVARVRK